MICFNQFLITIFLLAICITLSMSKNKYCDISPKHTMCIYKGLGPKCKNPGGSGVNPKEKQEILHFHNLLRSKVALGQELRGRGGPQKKAADMMKLYWDNSLAEVAQRWADQCDFGHDACRDDPRFHVGQNVFWKSSYPVHFVNWTEVVYGWYDEVELHDPRSVDSYMFDGATGHYTQLVWHDTKYIGCGRRDYGENKFYVCNYGPAGNVLTLPMYKVGEPCSKCPEKTTCKNGLCEKQENETVIEVTTAPDDSNDIIENDTKPEIRFQDYNEINLDSETLGEVENFKSQIVNLIKRIIRKTKLQHNIK